MGVVSHDPAVVRRNGDHFGHSHEVSRLIIPTRGESVIRVGKNTHPLSVGHAILIPGHLPVIHEAREPVTFVYIDMAVEDPQFQAIASVRLGSYWADSSCVLAPLAAFIHTLVRCDEAGANTQSERYDARRALEALVGCLLVVAPPLSRQEIETSTRNMALDYIRRNYANCALTAASLAKDLGISTRTLQRAFQEDRSVSHWITQSRLEAALAALCDPRFASMQIDEIATRSGFGSGVTLRRAVYAATGCTPGEYRQQNMYCDNSQEDDSDLAGPSNASSLTGPSGTSCEAGPSDSDLRPQQKVQELALADAR